MINKRVIALGLGLSLLAGCGSDGQNGTGQFLLQNLAGLLQRQPEQPPLRQRLTPEVIATIDGAILLVELPQIESQAGAQVLRTGNGHIIWSTLNQVHLTFREGVLVSTRGLPGDLLSSDVELVVNGVQRGGREAVRVNRYLDGDDQVVTRAYKCTYTRTPGQTTRTLTGSYRTVLVTETCFSTTDEIENQYWIDASRTVRKSKQWVGPFIGYMLTEQFND